MVQDYPLTKQQLGLWIEQQLHPSNTSYNTCVKLELTGELDVERFLLASTHVINYFDTLKVTFVEKDGIPFQRIDGANEYTPEFIDISDGKTSETCEKIAQAKAILSAKLSTTIDLSQFPIMRALLVKVASQSYFFIGMVPHIVSDGRAAILYLDSLSTAYNDGKAGLVAEYGKSKKSWDDYTRDQLHLEDSDTQNASRKYWNERLLDANHYFDYSYGKQLIDPDDKRGERVYFDLSAEMSNQLKRHCKKNRTTLFNVLVCAFSIFVHKYYSLKDILIGYPINIRPPGYKHFFGFFVNILPIRVDMSGDPSYQELLGRVHDVRKSDKRHQKYPALDMVADIRERVTDFDGRVFNLSMAQTVSRLFDLQLDGIETEPLDTEYYDVNDDFSLSYELIEERIGLWFEYRKALFDKAFIDQAMTHIELIISQLLSKPNRKISEFELLSKKEISSNCQLLSNQARISECGGKQKNNAKNKSIYGLFEVQVMKGPSSIAIVDQGKKYTYTQLNEMVISICSRIVNYTSDKAHAVVVSLERGVGQIASLLAVLKSGNFYIPIPVDFPNERKIRFIEEANACLWIGEFSIEDKHARNFNEQLTKIFPQLEVMSLSNIEYINGLPFQEDRIVRFAQDDLAYVIFTSGSTGTPKGVAITHSNVTCRLSWLSEYFKLEKGVRILQNTDFSFDVSVAEIFWPLVSGACLVLSDQNRSRDPEYLFSLIEGNAISVACMVPSLLNSLIQTDKQNKLSSLQHIICAGEALPPALRDRWLDSVSLRDCQLYNFYGPTEATIYASHEKLKRDKTATVGIGKPLGNTSFLVLDSAHQLCPPGVVGQLYIGGEGIAEGYLNDSRKTSRQFMYNPLFGGGDVEARYYATGDRVKYDKKGNLEYIGRDDLQVKIRGHRIELGEIETLILSLQGVIECAVVNRETSKGFSQLIAFIRLEDFPAHQKENRRSNGLNSVKEILHKKLPSYMVPSKFQSVKLIPLLNSGKVNKLELLKLLSQSDDLKTYVPPSNSIEYCLVEIWAELLDMQSARISVESSFFELGGDSLMAIQFVSLAQKHSIYFSMSDLFEYRCIKDLAQVAKSQATEVMAKNNAVGNLLSDSEILQGESTAYPLLPRQSKFFSDDFNNPNHWNRTFHFNVSHQLERKAFEKAVVGVLNHHPNLRVQFQQQDTGMWEQQVSKKINARASVEGLINFYELGDLAASERDVFITDKINQLHLEINLNRSPLMRIAYFSETGGGGQLAILFHHLLLDMVSSRIIFEDLIQAYLLATNKLPIVLPGIGSSVEEWANYLHTYASENSFNQSVKYWSSFPKQALPTIPIDMSLSSTNIQKEREKNETNDLDRRSRTLSSNREAFSKVRMFNLSTKTSNKLLLDLPQKYSMPIQDLLLAGLFETISNWSQEHQMTVSTCGHGRNVYSDQYDLSRTVGWLNTVYPVLLVNPTGKKISDLSNVDYLMMVKQQLEKIPTSNMDYNILRYIIKDPEITCHQSPQLFFNYVGKIDPIIPANSPFKPAMDLPGLASIAPDNHLCYLLYFEAGILGGRLLVRLTYSERLFSESTISNLIADFSNNVEKRVEDLELIQEKTEIE
jgi:amino acid adenylation domain-containing protein/non-ribosomal peptide synthase protein (TIGR01720 family)